MVKCPKCAAACVRVHRGRVEKIPLRHKYRCLQCRTIVRVPRALFDLTDWFLWSRHTRCVRCGNTSVERRDKRDRVDPMSRHLISRVLRIAGGRVYFCGPCRMQYYDWRPVQEPIASAGREDSSAA